MIASGAPGYFPLGFLPWAATAAVCFLVGGFSGLVWGAVVRTVFVWHATWSVNSICHKWGSRPHPTQENSGNVWWVGLWALGEGWHNNHHAFPRSARHGLRWYQIDVNWIQIWMLEKAGLLKHVYVYGEKDEKTEERMLQQAA